jgi:hypothetical protein
VLGLVEPRPRLLRYRRFALSRHRSGRAVGGRALLLSFCLRRFYRELPTGARFADEGKGLAYGIGGRVVHHRVKDDVLQYTEAFRRDLATEKHQCMAVLRYLRDSFEGNKPPTVRPALPNCTVFCSARGGMRHLIPSRSEASCRVPVVV